MLLPKLKSQRSTWRGSIRGTVFIWMCVFLSLSLPPSHPLSLSLTLLDNWVWPKREKNNPDIENYSSLSLGTVSLEWDARAGLHWLTKATNAHLFPTLLFSEVIWVAWTHFWWEDLHNAVDYASEFFSKIPQYRILKHIWHQEVGLGV